MTTVAPRVRLPQRFRLAEALEVPLLAVRLELARREALLERGLAVVDRERLLLVDAARHRHEREREARRDRRPADAEHTAAIVD